jgi:hypothetical protein
MPIPRSSLSEKSPPHQNPRGPVATVSASTEPPPHQSVDTRGGEAGVWLPVAEAAKIVGVAARTTYRWVAGGRLPSRNGSSGTEVEVVALRELAGNRGRRDSRGLAAIGRDRSRGIASAPATASTSSTVSATATRVPATTTADTATAGMGGTAVTHERAQEVADELLATQRVSVNLRELIEAFGRRLAQVEAQLEALQRPPQPCPGCRKVALALSVRCQKCGATGSLDGR